MGISQTEILGTLALHKVSTTIENELPYLQNEIMEIYRGAL